jgi:hypothetical protein
MKLIYRLVCLFCLLNLMACSQVKSWERGNLARPEMAFSNDPLAEKIQDHIFFSKEGSSSAAAGAGGGCGCN